MAHTSITENPIIFTMETLFDKNHLYKSYFSLSLPVMLGMIVSLVYNLTDTFFIAQTGNTNLIAGVSLCTPLFTTLMAAGNIFGQGGSSLISRMLGEGDEKGTRRISSFCFYISLVVGAVLAILLTLSSTPVLRLLGADSETMQYAKEYFTVLSVSSPIVVVNFIHTNLLRCEGKAKESMTATILGAVTNIILDPIMISTLGLGAFGAALATVIGYLVTVIFCLIVLLKKSRYLSVRPGDCRARGNEVGEILGVGISAALSNIAQSFTTILLNRFLLPYGNESIAAFGIVSKINMIVLLILTGFAFGGVPLFGYLYGADDREALGKIVRFCLLFLSLLALLLTAVILPAAPLLMKVFVSDTTLIETGAEMLRWQTVTSICVGLVLLYTVLFQAMGKVIPSLLLSISRQGIVFLIAIVICAHLFAYRGILMSQAVADVISAILAVAMYLHYSRKN